MDARRFLGNIRLFVTLRFDEIIDFITLRCNQEKWHKRERVCFVETLMPVYVVPFKCNKKLLSEYLNLFNYTKDKFQVIGMNSTVNMNSHQAALQWKPSFDQPFWDYPLWTKHRLLLTSWSTQIIHMKMSPKRSKYFTLELSSVFRNLELTKLSLSP